MSSTPTSSLAPLRSVQWPSFCQLRRAHVSALLPRRKIDSPGQRRPTGWRPPTPSSSAATRGLSCSSTVNIVANLRLPNFLSQDNIFLRNFGVLIAILGVCNLCNGGVRFVRENDRKRWDLFVFLKKNLNNYW